MQGVLLWKISDYKIQMEFNSASNVLNYLWITDDFLVPPNTDQMQAKTSTDWIHIWEYTREQNDGQFSSDPRHRWLLAKWSR